VRELRDHAALGVSADLGVGEHVTQRRRRDQRVGEGVELPANRLDDARLPGRVEESARVDSRDLLVAHR
jgi:hypothetical protein